MLSFSSCKGFAGKGELDHHIVADRIAQMSDLLSDGELEQQDDVVTC